MKSLVLSLALLMGVPAVTMSTTGCTVGQQTREDALTPAMIRTGGEIRVKALRGVANLPQVQQPTARKLVNEFFGIIQTKDIDRIRSEASIMWPQVRSLSIAGVEDMLADGEVDDATAESMYNTIDRYADALMAI